MTKLEELQEQLNKIQNEITTLKTEQQKQSTKRCRADEYWFLDDAGLTEKESDEKLPLDNFRYDTGNYFKTEEEAEDYKDRLLVHQELKDLALKLNNSEQINFNKPSQLKNYIYYSYSDKKIMQSYEKSSKDFNIYCLNDNFKDIAIEKIGDERLKNYLIKGV